MGAFTTQRFIGNPVVGVPDAAGLSVSEMQAIAREMNVSETAFIFLVGETPMDLPLYWISGNARAVVSW